jgi:hypothetical protein
MMDTLGGNPDETATFAGARKTISAIIVASFGERNITSDFV